MNACTKFNSNPSNDCEDILLWTKNVNLLVVPKEKSKAQWSQQDTEKTAWQAVVNLFYWIICYFNMVVPLQQMPGAQQSQNSSTYHISLQPN